VNSTGRNLLALLLLQLTGYKWSVLNLFQTGVLACVPTFS